VATYIKSATKAAREYAAGGELLENAAQRAERLVGDREKPIPYSYYPVATFRWNDVLLTRAANSIAATAAYIALAIVCGGILVRYRIKTEGGTQPRIGIGDTWLQRCQGARPAAARSGCVAPRLVTPATPSQLPADFDCADRGPCSTFLSPGVPTTLTNTRVRSIASAGSAGADYRPHQLLPRLCAHRRGVHGRVCALPGEAGSRWASERCAA